LRVEEVFQKEVTGNLACAGLPARLILQFNVAAHLEPQALVKKILRNLQLQLRSPADHIPAEVLIRFKVKVQVDALDVLVRKAIELLGKETAGTAPCCCAQSFGSSTHRGQRVMLDKLPQHQQGKYLFI